MLTKQLGLNDLFASDHSVEDGVSKHRIFLIFEFLNGLDATAVASKVRR